MRLEWDQLVRYHKTAQRFLTQKGHKLCRAQRDERLVHPRGGQFSGTQSHMKTSPGKVGLSRGLRLKYFKNRGASRQNTWASRTDSPEKGEPLTAT
jgi:hypothetical protein